MAVQHVIVLKLRAIGQGFRSLESGLQGVNSDMQNGMKIQTKAQASARNLGFRIQNLALTQRKFRMEMLSVMFFGMQMSNFFKGLLQPALRVAGVFDVLTATLQLLFLPVALWLLDHVFLPMLDFFGGLSDGVKKVIGAFAVGGVAFGTILFIIGQLALAVGGIIMAFVGFSGVILAIVASPLALLIAGLLGLGIVSGIQAIFDGFVESTLKPFAGILNQLYEWFLEKFPGVKEKLEEWGISTTSVWQAIKDVYKKGMDYINEKFGAYIESLKTYIKDSKEKFREWAEDSWEEFKKKFAAKVEENIPLFVDFGVKLGGAILKGMAQRLGNVIMTNIRAESDRTGGRWWQFPTSNTNTNTNTVNVNLQGSYSDEGGFATQVSDEVAARLTSINA